MRSFPYPMLNPAPFYWTGDHKHPQKVHEWIIPLDPEKNHDLSQFDAAILGIPLSRSSISASAASENPEAVRRSWKLFYPYHIEEDVDLTTLQIADIGDVRQHVTDISKCHENIREAMTAWQQQFPTVLPLCVGGDHSITAMLVKGWKTARPAERVGILQFDSHFDLRDLTDNGPTNGTPIRQLIEGGTVRGEDVYNIGLNGFYNARSLKDYADQHNVHYFTLKKIRQNGIESIVHEALAALHKKVDTIYMTVDMDVLDMAFAPAPPAAMPGGLNTDELFSAVLLAGTHPKVKAMDIVCLDPRKDVAGMTVRAATYCLLNFLTGFHQRKRKIEESSTS